MKNILFATTALVAFAGAASAQGVEVTGMGEIGVIGGDRYNNGPNDNDMEFWTDVDVTFTMTGEADNGLTFGASVDWDEAVNSPATGRGHGGATWFVAYGNARLDMGDTDGALDWAMQETNIAGGSIDDSETWHAGFNGNGGFDGNEDGQIARFTYTFNSFSAALSAEADDTANAVPGDDGTVWGLGVRYVANLAGADLGFGLGYQDQENSGTTWGVSVDTTLDNGLAFVVNYSEIDPDAAGLNTASHWGIGAAYTMNALTLAVNYGEYDNATGAGVAAIANGDSAHGFGLAANYDLGGGLVAQFGYGKGEMTAGGVTTDADSYSLGLAMSF